MTPCFKGSSRKKGRFLDLLLLFRLSVFIFRALDLIITSQCPPLSWKKWRMPQFCYFWYYWYIHEILKDTNLIILLGAKTDHRCYKAEVWGCEETVEIWGEGRPRRDGTTGGNKEERQRRQGVTDISIILFIICGIVVVHYKSLITANLSYGIRRCSTGKYSL